MRMLYRLLDDAGQDLRYALRTLRRDAGFATFAILIVGLGIGASSTIFSVVDALLLRPLPLRDASRLVWLANIANDQVTEWSIQVGSYLELRAQSKSIQDMAAYFTYFGNGGAKLTGEGEPVRLSAVPGLAELVFIPGSATDSWAILFSGRMQMERPEGIDAELYIVAAALRFES